MTKDILNDDAGRSMVEMLGTLAVMGVLSVGGIAGYNTAMNRMRANEVIDEANKRALVVAMSLAAGGGEEKASVSLAEFSNNEVAGATFDTVATMQDGLYRIKITNLPRKIYSLVKTSLGSKAGVKISEPCEPNGDSCSAFFYFDENLQGDPLALSGSSAAGSAQTAAPSYYCDPMNTGRICRADNPNACLPCNGTCGEAGRYGKREDLCQGFNFYCRDNMLFNGSGYGPGAATAAPCTCKGNETAAFYDDEEARAALCNSTSIQSFYCSAGGNVCRDVNSTQQCSQCPSRVCLDNGSGYSDFAAAMAAMCSVGPEPAVNTGYFECKDSGTRVCQVGTAVPGPGGTAVPDTCDACPTGYECLNGGYGYFNGLAEAVNNMCTGRAAGAGYFECRNDYGTVCPVGGSECGNCNGGCPSGYQGYYSNLQNALDNICTAIAGTYGPNYCAENGNTVCQAYPYGPDTCVSCPTGKYCKPYDTSYWGNEATGLCTGSAPDGAYYCYSNEKTVGNGNYYDTCNTGFACIANEVSRFDNLYDARTDLCQPVGLGGGYYCSPDGKTVGNGEFFERCSTGYACVPGKISRYEMAWDAAGELCKRNNSAVIPDGAYYCYSNEKSVGNGNYYETCNIGYACVAYEVSRYNNQYDARDELCRRTTRYVCGPEGHATGAYIVNGDNGDRYSCPSGNTCNPGAWNYYFDYQSALNEMCSSGPVGGPQTPAPAVGTTAPFECRNSNQVCKDPNYVLHSEATCVACPVDYTCSHHGVGYYHDYQEAKADMCTGRAAGGGGSFYCSGENLYGPDGYIEVPGGCGCHGGGYYRSQSDAISYMCTAGAGSVSGAPLIPFYCADGHFIYNASNGYNEATCGPGWHCTPGASGGYVDAQAASDALCQTSGPATEIPPDTAGYFECRNGQTVCPSGIGQCGNCNNGCPSGYRGYYSNLQNALDNICTALPVSGATVNPADTAGYFDCRNGQTVCPSGIADHCGNCDYGCNEGSRGYYSNLQAAKNALCSAFLPPPPTVNPADTAGYFDCRNGQTVCPSGIGDHCGNCDYGCNEGSRDYYSNLQAALDGLCAGRPAGAGTPGVDSQQSAQLPPAVSTEPTEAVTTQAWFDCLNNGNVGDHNHGGTAHCPSGYTCNEGENGMYDNMDSALGSLCRISITAAPTVAKADQTPVTNDLPWWV